MERIITKKQLVGQSTREDNNVTKVARWNAMNQTGDLDYNKYGIKDGIGLVPVSEMFVDNFVLKTIAASYQFLGQSYTKMGSVTKKIYEICEVANLKPVSCKGIATKEIKHVLQKDKLLPYVQDRDLKQEAELKAKGEKITFFWVEFKVACANIPYEQVMTYIRSEHYRSCNLFLKDIDCSIDTAGSFKKSEVVEHMTRNGFRLAGSEESQPRTIVDNDHKVGKNCLTFMETVGTFNIRAKFYNKMVQMLECKGVRCSPGQHWKDWVQQSDTRLARARDAARERGLTRAEVTIYCCEGIPELDQPTKVPTDDQISDILSGLLTYIPDHMVYSTPYVDTWKAYCEVMLHSLIIVDKDRNLALLVYTYNEVSRLVSGTFVRDWENNSHWCMSRLTLGEKLPIDIIDISENVENSTFTLKGNRYFKTAKMGEDRALTTRLVKSYAIFSHYCTDPKLDMNSKKKHNEELLQKAGLVPNDACHPVLAWNKANGASKSEVDLIHMGDSDVRVTDMVEIENVNQKKLNQEAYLERIRKTMKELQEKARQRYEKHTKLCLIKRLLSEPKERPCKIPLGTYDVVAIKQCPVRSILVLYMFGCHKSCFPTADVAQKITDTLDSLGPEQKVSLQHKGFDFLTFLDKPMAKLTFEKHTYTQTKHVVVHCSITFSPEIEMDIKNDCVEPTNIPETHIQHDDDAEQLPNLNQLEVGEYRNLPNLAVLPRDSIHTVISKCHLLHRNKQKLVVKLEDGNVYQAGRYLEQNEVLLSKDCKLKIGKIRTDVSSRNRYVLCTVAKKDDWAKLLTFEELPTLSMEEGREEIRVKDVATVEHKGKKRKLIRTDEDVIYRLKRTKFADTVIPNTMI